MDANFHDNEYRFLCGNSRLGHCIFLREKKNQLQLNWRKCNRISSNGKLKNSHSNAKKRKELKYFVFKRENRLLIFVSK